MSAAPLIGFAALGFFGSVHCIGMCGGFALAAGKHEGALTPCVAKQASYVVGKALGYAAIGGVAAMGFDWAFHSRDPESLGSLQRWLYIATGAMLVVLGLNQLLGLSLIPAAIRARARSLTRPFSALANGARALPGTTGTFAFGVVNALIPCGLSLGAIVLAVPLAPPLAALACFIFGMSTAPALIGLGWLPNLLPVKLRHRLPNLVGLALLAFGCATLFNAYRSEDETLPACCCDDVPDAPSNGPSH